MSYIAERNRNHCFPRGISRGTLESTFEFDSAEPVLEFDWGYGVKSEVFPKRYYVVKKVGDLWCGSCRDERIRPKHIQAVLDFIAAKEQAA